MIKSCGFLLKFRSSLFKGLQSLRQSLKVLKSFYRRKEMSVLQDKALKTVEKYNMLFKGAKHFRVKGNTVCFF